MAARDHETPAAGGRVCVGVIGGARGLKGDMRVKSFTATPEDVGAYGPVEDEKGERRFALRVTGRAGEQVIVRIDGVADRDAAERLRGVRLYVARAALPEPAADEFYHADLIGLRVERAGGGGEVVGTVKAVHDFGGGDLVEIARPAGDTVMVPFTRQRVPTVDLAGGRIVVAADELLDGETPPAAAQRDDGEDGE